MKDERINELIEDAIMECPIQVRVHGRELVFYPPSLGKLMLVRRLLASLGINEEYLRFNANLEVLRLVSEKKDIASRIIAYYTAKTKAEVFDTAHIDKIAKFIAKNADEKALATMLSIVLADNTARYMSHLGIKKELDRFRRASNVKTSEDGQNVNFCGTSLYGQIIDYACERYGWTMEYVVWGISYTNLQMLMADSVKSLYMTKDDMRKAHISGGARISADDSGNNELIKSMKWD